MNILEGVKSNNPRPNATSSKFIIKSKPSIKDNKVHQLQNQSPYASNQDVHQLITYIVTKSKKLSDLLEAKNISNTTEFHEKNLYENPCIRTLLKAIMDRLIAERRLGKNLKGINKGLLAEIQGYIWQGIERQITLYHLDKLYEKEKSSLQSELNARKLEIEKQIQSLAAQKSANDEKSSSTKEEITKE